MNSGDTTYNAEHAEHAEKVIVSGVVQAFRPAHTAGLKARTTTVKCGGLW